MRRGMRREQQRATVAHGQGSRQPGNIAQTPTFSYRYCRGARLWQGVRSHKARVESGAEAHPLATLEGAQMQTEAKVCIDAVTLTVRGRGRLRAFAGLAVRRCLLAGRGLLRRAHGGGCGGCGGRAENCIRIVVRQQAAAAALDGGRDRVGRAGGERQRVGVIRQRGIHEVKVACGGKEKGGWRRSVQGDEADVAI